MMSRRGFTLIEVLIAITILAILVGIVFAAFDTVINSTNESRRAAKWMRRQQFLVRSFERNFPAAFVDSALENPAYRFEGENGDGPDGPRDTVIFCSTAPLIGGAALPGDLKQVRYALVDSAASTFAAMLGADAPGGVIEATEAPLLGANHAVDLGGMTDSSAKDFMDTATVEFPHWSLPEIRSLDITYFDGVKYVETWDSTEFGRLPWCVNIKINYWKSKDELAEERRSGIDSDENPDFEMVIPITMGMGITEDMRTALEAAGPTGPGQENEPGTGPGEGGRKPTAARPGEPRPRVPGPGARP